MQAAFVVGREAGTRAIETGNRAAYGSRLEAGILDQVRPSAMRDGELHEVKSPIILQPGPAALTDGVREMARVIRDWSAKHMDS